MPNHRPRKHKLFPTVEAVEHETHRAKVQAEMAELKRNVEYAKGNTKAIIEIVKKPKLVKSDHLPIYLQVPTKNGFISIASLNMLGPGAPSGFHKAGNWETNEEAIARYREMLGSIKALNGKVNGDNGLDAICLQECNLGLLTRDFVQEQLGDEWEIEINQKTDTTAGEERITAGQIITCYKKARFEKTSVDHDTKNRVTTLELKDKQNDNKKVILNNVWGLFHSFPDKHEALYRSLLANHYLEPGEFSILVGDTNSRIAPLDDQRRNIMTAIVPVASNELNGAEEDEQIPDFPDGGFYCGADGLIHQIDDIKVFDFSRGNFVEDYRLAHEVECWPEKRMLLCLDYTYDKTEFIDGKTVFEYEADLRAYTGDNSILVRRCADSFNNKGIGIRFNPNSALLNYLYGQFKDELGFQFKQVQDDNLGYQVPCAFVSDYNLDVLNNCIEEFVLQHKLEACLQGEFNTKDVHVENMTNHMLLKIKFPPESSEIYNELKTKLSSSYGFEIKEEDSAIVVEKPQLKTLRTAVCNSADTVRQTILKDIDTRLLALSGKKNVLQKISHAFVMDIPEKFEALSAFRKKIENARFGSTKEDYLRIYNNWKTTKAYRSKKNPDKVVTNGDVIQRHRNFLFSPQREGKTNRTQAMLEKLERRLGGP